jgi:hypothetical protein
MPGLPGTFNIAPAGGLLPGWLPALPGLVRS